MSETPAVSFEFFPPSDEASESGLWDVVAKLAPLAPKFFSVTYGAGGSARERTDRVVRRIHSEMPGVAAAHLTCVGATREEVDELAASWWRAGVRHVVALRGDPPVGTTSYAPHPGGYENAAALVAGIRRLHEFEVSVAAYPEIHPDSLNKAADLENLKRKVDAGACRAITQYFFDNDMYLRFRDSAVRAGIAVPIVPGILPVTNFAKVVEFSKRCGATVPNWMAELFDGLDRDPETRMLVAATTALDQCDRLRQEGVDTFHFYTLNRAALSYAICWRLGLRPVFRKVA